MLLSAVRQGLQSHGLAKPDPPGSPCRSHPSQSSTDKTKHEQVSLGSVPWDNLTQTDTGFSPWGREHSISGPGARSSGLVPALTSICFVIWSPCHFPSPGLSQARRCLWSLLALGFCRPGQSLLGNRPQSGIHVSFPDPSAVK